MAAVQNYRNMAAEEVVPPAVPVTLQGHLFFFILGMSLIMTPISLSAKNLPAVVHAL